MKAIVKAFDETQDSLDGKTDEQAAKLAARTAASSEMMQAKARAAFEMALASRVHTAAEIEVEEYYDAEGGGGIGLDVAKKQLGLHGSGKKVTRRVIKLKGWPDHPDSEAVLQLPPESDHPDATE